jgi:pilus assembly protein CpaF
MLDETKIDLKNIFSFKQEGLDEEGKVLGKFTATGYVPSFYDDMLARGVKISKDIFKPSE